MTKQEKVKRIADILSETCVEKSKSFNCTTVTCYECYAQALVDAGLDFPKKLTLMRHSIRHY